MTPQTAPEAAQRSETMRKRTLAALVGLVAALGLAIVMSGDVSAAALVTNVKLVVQADYTSALDLVTSESKLRKSYSLELASGTGADQADMVFSDQRTIAASTTEDLDVSGGTLTDAFGTTFTVVKVKLLMVCASSANTNDVVILGDAASVPILDTAATTHTIAPGGCFCAYDPTLGGWAVTASTGDIIQVANSGAGTTVTYDIVVIGTSA